MDFELRVCVRCECCKVEDCPALKRNGGNETEIPKGCWRVKIIEDHKRNREHDKLTP